MIGVIISAHSNLASALVNNAKMLAGESVNLKACDFISGTDIDGLDVALEQAVQACNTCDYIYILTDIVGGTPFNRASLLKANNSKIKVISGVNTAMVLELVMKNMAGVAIDDIDSLTSEVLESAKDSVTEFNMENNKPVDDNFDEGI